MKCMQESPHSSSWNASGFVNMFYLESVLTDDPFPLLSFRNDQCDLAPLLSLSKENNNAFNFSLGTVLTRVIY